MQFLKLTKDGLKWLLTENKLSTMGSRPPDVQTVQIVHLSRHILAIAPAAPLPVRTVAAAAGQAVAIVANYCRRRRAKRRRRYHHSRRYHAVDDWLNPSASGSIPCAPRISRQLQRAIQRGKYASFSKLLLQLDTPPPPLINPSKSKSCHDKTENIMLQI